MAKETGIGWTDSTMNAVTGCSKVSSGCKNCYAERVWPRLSGNDKTIYFGREFNNVKCHPEVIGQSARWTRPRMVFLNSMSDTFHPDVPDAFIDQMFAAMMLTGQHTYQVLTKRIDRAVDYLSRPERKELVADAASGLPASGNPAFNGYAFTDFCWPLPNVWLGCSVEDQAVADERIHKLLQAPAVIRFLSVEPMIGVINLKSVSDGSGQRRNMLTGGLRVDWVILGCESGSARRKLDIDWVRAIRSSCAEHSVPFFLKQLFIGGELVSEPVLDGRQSVEFPLPPMNKPKLAA